MSAQLTEDELQFLKEAEAGGFGTGYGADGRPYATGARDTGNLFSMDVEEGHDPDGGSTYWLRRT